MPIDDDDIVPDLPAKAVELLQLVDAAAVLVHHQSHGSEIHVTFSLTAPTALWPGHQWPELPRYLYSAGKNGLLELEWGWADGGRGSTLRLTDLGRRHIAGHPPVMMVQPQQGETGWLHNPVALMPPWTLCEGNIVHATSPDGSGLRLQIGRIVHRDGTTHVHSARTERTVQFPADAQVPVETASLSAAQQAAVADRLAKQQEPAPVG